MQSAVLAAALQLAGPMGGACAGRQESFTVKLRTLAGQDLPSIEHAGEQYFVGEPGQEFKVMVTRTTSSKNDYQVNLDVDGVSPGYQHAIHRSKQSATAVFDGWLQKTEFAPGKYASAYRAFKMASCRPSQTAVTVDSVDEFAAGRIKVHIKQVKETGVAKASSGGKTLNTAAPDNTRTDRKLPEEKKWFLAPGLKVEMGSLGAPLDTGNWNKTIYETVTYLPSLEVRYDSSEALYLRKVLDPTSEAHRDILRGSSNPAIANEAAAHDTAPTSGPTAAAAAPARGSTAAYASAAAAAAAAAAGVSLPVGWPLQPAVPLIVNGREVGPDELAVCDLCDDEGPKWKTKKRRVVQVEVELDT